MSWLLGTTLLASFLRGLVALLAPCCISVMLPAYLATGFRQRRLSERKLRRKLD